MRLNSSSQTASADVGLVRALGTFGLAASIINITVGGGIFRLPADVAKSLGAAGPLAYLVCSLALALIVLCFADAGSRVSLTGGPYAYVEVAFGPFVGFMAGVLVWLLGTFAMAAVSTLFAGGLGALVPALSGPGGRITILITTFALLGAINIRGIKQGARLNNVATVAKLVPLLLLAIGGLFAIRAENLAVVAWPVASDVARTSIILIFAFSGVETALVPSGEIRDPARTVPRAIFIAMLGITLLYLTLQVVARGVLGDGLATETTAPLAAAAGVALGGWARAVLLVGATISMFGYMGGMTLAVPRALFAFARDGFLPSALARVHPRFHTPHLAIAVQSCIVAALALSGTFERLAILSNICVLLLYGACCAASWVLRRRGVQQGGTPFRVPLAGLVPWLACAVIAWMLTSITASEWLALAITLGAATLVFFGSRARRSVRAADSPNV